MKGLKLGAYMFMAAIPYLMLIMLLLWYFINEGCKVSKNDLGPEKLETSPKIDFNLGNAPTKFSQVYNVEEPLPQKDVLSIVKKLEQTQKWKFTKTSIGRWKLLETDSFTISSESTKRNTLVAAFYLEMFYKHIGEVLPLSNTPNEKFKIRYFRSKSKFRTYAKSTETPTALSFYNLDEKEVVVCDSDEVITKGFLSNLLHEATHQYLDIYYNESLPYWVSEGMAEYFSTGELHNDILTFGSIIKAHIFTLKNAIKNGELIPLNELVQLDKEKFYGINASLAYAESWVLIHLIMKNSDKVTAIQRLTQIWKGTNEKWFIDLEAEWRDYISVLINEQG